MRILMVLGLVAAFTANAEEAKVEKNPTDKKELKVEMKKAKNEAKRVKKEAKEDAKAAAKTTEKKVERTDGLKIEDEKVGSGKEAKLGSKITVHYKGTLKSGKEFDSSYGSDPITFELLEGRLIKGWTEGIPGMKVGGKRKLSIPYAMAYGERGTPDGSIPPKSDLDFEVELVDVK